MRCGKKNMEIEAVFIETEMIIAWNVNFLWIMRCGKKKKWSLKLYLSRQKWSKLETLIFLNMRCGKKNMEIEAVFIETEMIKAWNVNFLKNEVC